MKRFSLSDLLWFVAAIAMLCGIARFWWPDLDPNSMTMRAVVAFCAGWQLNADMSSPHTMYEDFASILGGAARIIIQAGSLIFAVVLTIRTGRRLIGKN